MIRICFLLAAWVSSAGVLPAADARPIHIKVLPGLRYDIESFTVRPGEPLAVLFENNGVMMHNLVIIRPDTLHEVLTASTALGADGPALQYVPDSDAVMYHTRVLNMKERQTLSFDAPEVEGAYWFVCTFPGHGQVMKGRMIVSAKAKPGILRVNVPKQIAAGKEATERAIVQRMWLPDASPAAIAVSLPGGQKFVWDAEPCRLRYLWRTGGFPNHRPHAESNGKPVPPFTGAVHTRETTFPFPDLAGAPRFLGYRLDASGIPTFRYQVDGVEIHERLSGIEGGVERQFRFSPVPDRALHLLRPPDAASRYAADRGQWEGDALHLPAGTESVTLIIREAP